MKYENVTIKELPHSETEITGEIPVAAVSDFKKRALKHLASEKEIKGFRKGHAPEHVIEQHLGEMEVLKEAAHEAILDAYPDIITEHKIEAIGTPELTVTKLAPGNPIAFSVRTAVMPKITLPEYKSIAAGIKEEKAEPATEKEVADTITAVQTQRKSPDDETLPKVTDAFVKTLGDFSDVADFKTKITEGITQEKARKTREKRRAQILDAIAEATDADLPRLLIESELDRMLAQFKGEVGRMGMAFPAYLTQIGKKEEDLRKEWETDAKKRVLLELLFAKIAEAENIVPKEEDVEKEVAHITEHVKDADPIRVRSYVTTTLTNEKILELLENPQ